MLPYTPLRYPGGKRRLAHVIKRLLEVNELTDVQYAEPYAGGAAIAIGLLIEEYASVVHINDLARPVYAFWHTVLNENEWLCKRLQGVKVNISTWRRQRGVYRRRETADLAELGFAALYLNRTNRSGIISGGVIGGLGQKSKWGVDARFNKEELLSRIQKIGRYASRIKLYQQDALDFTNNVVPTLGKKSFVFYDPPYIERGKDLYLNEYDVAGHRKLATRIQRLSQPWVVTYDHAAIAHGLYDQRRRIAYDIHYVAQDRHLGREVLFLADRLKLPPAPSLLGERLYLVRHQTRLSVN